MEGAAARDGVVLDGIADERLQREGRKQPRTVFVIHVDVEEELVGIADFEQIAIRLGEAQLLAQRHERALPVLDDVAERIGELVDVGQRLLAVTLAHEHGQRVERIEEEMGVDLTDQHVVARRQVLVLQPFVLQHDGLPLRDEHIDAPVEHRYRHGERTFEQQQVVEHPPAHEIEDDAPRMPLRDGGYQVEQHRRHEAPQRALDESPRGVVRGRGGQYRQQNERHDKVVEQLEQHLDRP